MTKAITVHELTEGCRVSIAVEPRPMTVDEARQLAEELLAAAERAERIDSAKATHHLVRYTSV
jgi:hypothetical protein